jgi:hypothetical protein
MFPFLLYFVAAVVTGFHLYTLLSLVVLGVPVHPLEVVALLGSLCLLIAAYISLFRPYAAAKLALLAALAIWSVYGPALANVVRTKMEERGTSSNVTLSRPADVGGTLKLELGAELRILVAT